jgi:hypothetical protein
MAKKVTPPVVELDDTAYIGSEPCALCHVRPLCARFAIECEGYRSWVRDGNLTHAIMQMRRGMEACLPLNSDYGDPDT